MDSPFNNGHWGSLPWRPRYPQNFRAVPIATAQTTPSPSHRPKFVSIPVRFVQPDNSRSDYAIRIQKVWRGFRLRKSVKKIREIQQELGEVERVILDSQTVEALRRDERERLKVNERLMALLFRLDSIRGFDSAIKDLRRTFTRRAILLQEKVDSIAVSAKNSIDQPMEGDDDSGDKLHCELEPVERELVVVKEEESNTIEECTRNKEMLELERMLEDNTTRLMKLMAVLLEKSEKQTRMLGTLSERVEQLENAFACEKLLRRAKKLKKSRNSKSPYKNKGY